MFGKDCLIHFLWWMIHLGDKCYLYPDNISDIAQKEGSGGPRPVPSQSYWVGGQYLSSHVGL